MGLKVCVCVGGGGAQTYHCPPINASAHIHTFDLSLNYIVIIFHLGAYKRFWAWEGGGLADRWALVAYFSFFKWRKKDQKCVSGGGGWGWGHVPYSHLY